jgi:hypothetical protein
VARKRHHHFSRTTEYMFLTTDFTDDTDFLPIAAAKAAIMDDFTDYFT